MIAIKTVLANGDGLIKLIVPLAIMIIYAVFTVIGKAIQKARQDEARARGAGGPQPRPPARARQAGIERFLQEVMGQRPAQPPGAPQAQDEFEVLTEVRPVGQAGRAGVAPARPVGAPAPAARPFGQAGVPPAAPARLRREAEPTLEVLPLEEAEPKPSPISLDLSADLEQRVRSDMKRADQHPPEEKLPDATSIAMGAVRRAPHSGLAALLAGGQLDLRSAIVISEVFGPPRARRRGGPRRR